MSYSGSTNFWVVIVKQFNKVFVIAFVFGLLHMSCCLKIILVVCLLFNRHLGIGTNRGPDGKGEFDKGVFILPAYSLKA